MKPIKHIVLWITPFVMFNSCSKDGLFSKNSSDKNKPYLVTIHMITYRSKQQSHTSYDYNDNPRTTYYTTYTKDKEESYELNSNETDKLEIKDWRATVDVSKNQDNTFNVDVQYSSCGWNFNFTLPDNGNTLNDSQFTDQCGKLEISVSITKK